LHVENVGLKSWEAYEFKKWRARAAFIEVYVMLKNKGRVHAAGHTVIQ